MFLCSSVCRVSGCQATLRRQPLCFLGHPDASPWPSAAQRLICFLCSLCSYVSAVSASQPRSGLMSLCPSVLLSPALAAAKPRSRPHCPHKCHIIKHNIKKYCKKLARNKTTLYICPVKSNESKHTTYTLLALHYLPTLY